MAEFVFMAHSGWRYAVLVVGVLVLVLAAAGLGGRTNLARSAERMYRVFATVLDIQFLLGIGTAILRPFVPMYIGHIVMMVLAIAITHILGGRLKKLDPGVHKPGVVLVGVLVALALIVGGILAIRRPLL